MLTKLTAAGSYEDGDLELTRLKHTFEHNGDTFGVAAAYEEAAVRKRLHTDSELEDNTQ